MAKINRHGMNDMIINDLNKAPMNAQQKLISWLIIASTMGLIGNTVFKACQSAPKQPSVGLTHPKTSPR